mgnify:CR=1 FL=1
MEFTARRPFHPQRLHAAIDMLLVRIDTHKDRAGFLPDVAAELELESDPDTHAITWTFRAASSADADAVGPAAEVSAATLAGTGTRWIVDRAPSLPA